MAVFRQVQITFWQDGFILGLNPEEKYFYLYLMTNSKTSQCGIYELPKQIIKIETAYDNETVDRLINKFIEYKKILYCESTSEIMILNWIKYNGSNSPKIKSRVLKELKDIKCAEYTDKYRTLSILYGYCMDTESQKEKEKEKEEEEEEEEEEDISAAAENASEKIINIFNQNIHMVTPLEADKLKTYLEDMDGEVIELAIQEAVSNNARNMRYIETILNNWLSKEIKTVDAVKAYMRDRQDKKKNQEKAQIVKNKSNKFHNYNQTKTNYTNDELENILRNKRGGG